MFARHTVTLAAVASLVLVGCSDKTTPNYIGWVPPGPPPGTTKDGGAARDGRARDAQQDTLAPDTTVSADAGQSCTGTPSTFTITGGQLNATALVSATPSLTISPGEYIYGTVQIAVERNDACATCTFSHGWTPTWGVPQSSYDCEGSAPAGKSTKTAVIDLTGPFAAGTYHLILAGALEKDCDHVMAATSSDLTVPKWGDGNDVAAWSLATLSSAASQGYVCADWLTAAGMGKSYVAAAVVQIVVQ
jgi:hypothetical protein